MSSESIRLWFRLFIINDLASICFLFVWLLINISLFIGHFFHYHRSLSYFYLRVLISDGLSVAQASALCLNFNCFLILLPVCRKLFSLIQYILPQCIIQSRFYHFMRRLFNQHIGFHRCIGYAIGFWSLVHVGTYVYNYERLIDIQNQHLTLSAALNGLYLISSESVVNPFDRVHPNALRVDAMLNTTAGVTGVILCLCLLMIFSSSTRLIHRSFYELFWFTHHLFIIFFVCLGVHGIQGFIRSQINVDEHNPDICAILYRQWGINQQCLIYPRFKSSTPTSWIWFCVPLALYILERFLRFLCSLQTIEIIDIIRHQSNIVELRFRKKSMSKPQPGQYIYLKCFSISKFTWHPFIVTSSTEEPYISIHIRTVGNWTKELVKRFEMYPRKTIPRLGIDGPYGSPIDDVFKYDTVILVAAGIGVRPYAAILKHIRACQSNQIRLRRVYFYWICNTISCYEWFIEILQQLEYDLRYRQNLFMYHIYLTQNFNNNTNQRNIWTGLENKIYYGRPNFELDFQNIIHDNWQIIGKRHIGVFVCGSKSLVNQLQRLCIKFNDHYSLTNNVYFHIK